MRRGSGVLGVLAACAALGVGASAAGAVPVLNWKPCGDAAGVKCATATVPKDYANAGAGTLKLFVANSPATDHAHRIGSLFFNFGGPGAPAADAVEFLGSDLFPELNKRFDIVGMDPRGVGQSEPSIDCKANQETQGIYSSPFTTPENLDAGALIRKDVRYVSRCVSLNGSILPYVATANVARDLDQLRAAVGDQKLTYLGFSYGTYLGATYASLFPTRFRALVLDGPVDANAYANHPMNDIAEQTSGFERALGRFLQACAGDQGACAGFGGTDPWDALDLLIEQANLKPIPATGYTPDPRPVDGDDIINAVIDDLYGKQFWPELAGFLADAQNGDGSGIRFLADQISGRQDDGSFDPGTDRYFTIGAVDQDYPKVHSLPGDAQLYLDAGDHSWGLFDHFWSNSGYVELNYGLFDVQTRGVFRGPFKVPSSSPTPLVTAVTYDPATPYRGAKRLVRSLGNARLLTMRGDGHTAYEEGSPDCVDTAVEAYLIRGVLPPVGKVCRQDVPFAQFDAQSLAKAPASTQARLPRHLKARPPVR